MAIGTDEWLGQVSEEILEPEHEARVKKVKVDLEFTSVRIVASK